MPMSENCAPRGAFVMFEALILLFSFLTDSRIESLDDGYVKGCMRDIENTCRPPHQCELAYWVWPDPPTVA